MNLYDGEIRFSDEVAGTLLDKLDQLDLTKDTLVIITSDHGEEFFEHNNLEHGHTVYQEVLHVPLIMRLPGQIPFGREIREPVSLIDLFPTLLDFTGASVEPKLYRGESLKEAILKGDMAFAGGGQMNLTIGTGGGKSGVILPSDDSFLLMGESFTAVGDASDALSGAVGDRLRPGSREEFIPPEGRVIFAEDLFYYDHDLQALIIGDWKYIHSRNRFHDPVILSGKKANEDVTTMGLPEFIEGDELYNIADDPHEWKNVIYDYPEIAQYMFGRLEEINERDRQEGYMRKQMEGEMTYFGAGLKNLTRSFGYFESQ